jgi:general secretion pathway protein C
MNAILLKIQKNTFITLVPVVMLLSFSIGNLLRTVLIAFLNPPQVQTTPQNQRAMPQQAASKILPVATYEEAIEGGLIRGKINIEDPKAALNNEAQKKVASLATEEVPGSDEMVIWGTVSGSPIFARVAIQEKGQPESEEYSIGNVVGGYTVKAILQSAVVLDKNGIALKVDIGEKVGEARKRYLESAQNQETGEGDTDALVSAETVKQLISREDINKHLKNPTAIYDNARFGPNLVNGKIDGYKLYQVGKSNLMYSLGARSGDNVKRVNGMPLNDTGKMFEIFNSIKTAPKISVDIERKGKIITYEFTVQN